MAAAITLLEIDHARDNFPAHIAKATSTEVREIARFVRALAAGSEGGTQIVRLGHAVAGTGTVTAASVSAADTVTVNGVVFTAEASGATGNQFNVGGSDAITATNLAAAINGSVTAKVSGMVSASAASNVVTITMLQPGVTGSLGTLTSSNGTRLAVGATPFANAANDARVAYTLR